MIHAVTSSGQYFEDNKQRWATSFGVVADAYERARPSYPPEAVRWLLDLDGRTEPPQVIDLGAGTGKLTRVMTELIPAGSVVAVEPLAGM